MDTDYTHLPVSSNSGNIVSAAYNADTRSLQVRFKTGLYEYEDVAPDIWDGFKGTFQTEDSTGAFFHNRIKDLKFKRIA